MVCVDLLGETQCSGSVGDRPIKSEVKFGAFRRRATEH